MTDYSKQAKEAAAELIRAGQYAEHIEHVNVVKVRIGHENWYVSNLADFYLSNLEIGGSKLVGHGIGRAKLTILYKNNTTYIFALDLYEVDINGRKYQFGGDECENPCSGHLIDNIYTSYINMWFLVNSYPFQLCFNEYYETETAPVIECGDILDEDFNPAGNEVINIKNTGFKIIDPRYRINNNNIKTFTAFGYKGDISVGYEDYIADGKYIGLEHIGPFWCANEAGERFALLIDPQTGLAELASATKNIKLSDLNDYEVMPIDGLYNGYEIITPKLAIVNDCANTTTTSVIMPSNYMYGYTFFAVDKLGKIVELDVRKYNSGARTKPALL